MSITLTQFDRIEVEWLDAALGVNYQGPADQSGTLATMRRIGYFIGRRKHATGMSYLVLASERTDGDEIREPMAIPEQWVTSITRLDSGKTYAKGGRVAKKKGKKKGY